MGELDHGVGEKGKTIQLMLGHTKMVVFCANK